MSKHSLDISFKPKKVTGPRDVFDQFHDYPVCDIPPTGRKYVDTMEMYRPKKKDMAQIKDYELTQAYTIMDRDPVKIRMRDTDCQYKFHPPGYSSSAKRDSRGGHGPLDKLLMEEFVDVIDYYQYIARQELARKISVRKAKAKEEQRQLRSSFDKRLGPDWFQELSNVQRAAVDNLAKAIVSDLSRKTIEKTQLIVAQLGLVLRPHHALIKRALWLCASCPVEFLLVLYQLINPHRTTYSINDRLLLSAVVHLTIRSTLRELHIRIPSPPRPASKVARSKKVTPKALGQSPYLQDLLLRDKVDCRRFHAPNKYYVDNEYFNYANQLRCNHILLRVTAEGDTHRDFQFEKTYTGGVCTCDNCSFPECTAAKDVDEFTRIEIDLITEWTKAQKYYNSLVSTDYTPALFKPSVYVCPIGNFRPQTTEAVSFIKKETLPESSGSSDDQSEQKCSCKSQQALLTQPTESKTVDSQTVAFTDQEPECICSVDVTEECIFEEEDFCSENTPVTPVPYNQIDLAFGPLLSVKTVESETCACKDAILKRIEDSLCHCKRCEDDRRRQNSLLTYVIDDTKETPDKPVPIIKGCQAKPICTCMEKYQKRWEQFERTRGVRKVQEALKSLDEKFVITGTAIGPDGKIVYILSSVLPKRCCQCSRIKEMEEEDKRTLKQMPMLPGGCIKYHIAGVQERPEGNVFVLAGTTENTECDCMAIYERFTREHSLCMKLYNEYMKKIAYDMQEYLKEVDSKYCDFAASATWTDSEVEVIEKSCPCHCDRGTQMCCCYCSCNTNTEDSVDCICSVQSCPCGFGQCECITEEGFAVDESLYEGGTECICTPSSDVSNQEDPTSTNCACTITKDSSKKLDSCDESEPMARNAGKSKDVHADAVEKTEDDIFDKIREGYKKHPLYRIEDPPVLERYMIFKALPPTVHKQTVVLKKALKKLAEDGFPLAHLPDVHLLPIFKAWWRYRLHKYYTAGERKNMLDLEDKFLLQQIDLSRPTPATLKTNFLRKRKFMHNWDHRSFIKAHNLSDRTNYYRNAKHISINYARELYTLMRQYEFSNHTFHDVFFAYMPSKEEDIQVDQIWKPSDKKKRQAK